MTSDFHVAALVYEGAVALLAIGSLTCIVLANRAFREGRAQRGRWLLLAPVLAFAVGALLLLRFHLMLPTKP